jgi:eukaryotic-like serine/threonine-protein kinase
MAQSKQDPVCPDLAAMRQAPAVIAAFRQAWQRGETPSISDFLPADGPGRLELLLELAAADLACRRERGQLACVETYLRDWPELAADQDLKVELIRREWEARAAAEPARLQQELMERFPEVAPAIADLSLPRPQTPLVTTPWLPADTPRVGGGGSPGPWPQVPGYEVLGELGRGGFGVVYRARQLKLGRLVALKMLLSGAYAGEEELARFRREAEAMAGIQHPYIAQVYDVGVQAGQPFFTM